MLTLQSGQVFDSDLLSSVEYKVNCEDRNFKIGIIDLGIRINAKSHSNKYQFFPNLYRVHEIAENIIMLFF